MAALQGRIGNAAVLQMVAAKPGAPAVSGVSLLMAAHAPVAGPTIALAPGRPAPKTAGPRAPAAGGAGAAAKGEPGGSKEDEAAQASQAEGAAAEGPVGKPAGAAKPGEAGKGAADAAGPDAEGGKAGAEGGAVAVQLHMPEPPTGPSPATMRRISGVKARAGGRAAAHGALPSAATQVGGARQAVTPPDAERAAAAQAALIAQVHAAPSPEIVALCERIRQVIRDKRPPDEDALAAAKPDAAATEAGNQLNSTVQGETKKVQDNYGAVNAKPATPGAPAVPGVPPQPAAAETAAVNAKAAKPDAVPAENVSLDKDVADAKKKTVDAGMDTEPAKLIQGGPVAEARDASGELAQTAKEDPAKVLAKQKEALGAAEADMASLQMQALNALTASREGAVKGAGSRQTAMVGSEEQMRAQAGGEAKKIFDDAQTAVNGLLKDLPSKAMDQWEAAKEILVSKFKADLAIVQKRVDERHSGASGFVVGLWDAVTGLPGWAEDAYTRAETNFGDGVIEKLTKISTEVNAVIAACDLIIKGARDRIADVFKKLPASLQGWAEGEQTKFDHQLDQLHNQVIAARDNFNKDLVERSSAAVDEVRAEIADLRKKAGGLIGRIANAIARFIDDPVKFIIEGLLELLGIPPAAFWAVVAKIKKCVKDIASDPLGFADNLLKGLGQGFSQFFDNFGEHMIRGFLTWLLGDLKGVQIPKDVSLKSIVTFFLQLMGITWPNIRKILVDKIGAKNVALVEKVYSMVSLLIEKGPEGIYEMIKDKLDPQAIVDQVVDMAVDFMVTAIAKQVAARLLLLFNPAGAIAQALEAIYRVLKWVFLNAARIFALVETVVNGIADIIAGNVGGFANAVEKALGMLIAPVIGFIADYFSLGDLPSIVATKIKSMQKWILGLIEKAIVWLIDKGKALLAAIGIGKKDKEPGKKGEGAVGEAVTIDAPDETHTLYVEVRGGNATLMVASNTPMTVTKKLEDFHKRIKQVDKNERPVVEGLITEARGLTSQADKQADAIVRAQEKADAATSAPPPQSTVVSDEYKIAEILKKLYAAFGERGPRPVAGTHGELISGGKSSPDQESHHVPPKAVLGWIVEVCKEAKGPLEQSKFAEHVDFKWIAEIAGISSTVYDPGNPLAAIAVHNETHIKKGADPDSHPWRIHWGSETAKAVFARLKNKTVTVKVDGVDTKLSFVFIRRRLFEDLSAEDQQAVLDWEAEAEEPLSGLDVGKIPGAAGLAISTQFFKTELRAALHETQGKTKIDVENLAENLGMVARGAAAVSREAVEVALQASKQDGSPEEKAAALSKLRGLSRATWNALKGIKKLKML